MSEDVPVSAADVARWMLAEFERNAGRLLQADAQMQIQQRFGEGFVHPSRRGGNSIDRLVLQKFRELTGEAVVWDMNEGGWRRRRSGDPPGTRHAYE
jgi:hypothetical protein